LLKVLYKVVKASHIDACQIPGTPMPNSVDSPLRRVARPEFSSSQSVVTSTLSRDSNTENLKNPPRNSSNR
jgi:hypothetical protein